MGLRVLRLGAARLPRLARGRRNWRAILFGMELYEAELLWRQVGGAVVHDFLDAPVLVLEEAASNSARWDRHLCLGGSWAAMRCAAVGHAPP